MVFKAPVINKDGIVSQTVFKDKRKSENGAKHTGDNCNFQLEHAMQKNRYMKENPASAGTGMSGRIQSNLPFLPGILMPREKRMSELT